MTNLTSEQYREILRHIPNCTEEIPTIQQLLRRGVKTFFTRFGAYPELAGVAPGKVSLFGEQTQFSDGLAVPAATPMATIVLGRRVPGNHFSVVTSADVGKPHKVKFSFTRNHPLRTGCPEWINHVKGVIDSYPEEVPPFEAAIESSVPMGVGLGSTAALEVATYTFLEVLVGKRTDVVRKTFDLQAAEKDFLGKDVGFVDRITACMAKDRQVIVINQECTDIKWVPFRHPKVTMVAVDSHLKDELFGDEYPERSKHLAKACEILGLESLRNCTEEDLEELANRVNDILAAEEEAMQEEEEEEGEGEEIEEGQPEEEKWTREDYDKMIKRARFFITEMQRIRDAVEAWVQGDVQTFGEKLKESHKSLKEDFDFNNPVLDFLVETSLEVEGVLGSKMTGMGLGFGGGIISLVNKNNVEKYCNYITEKFMEHEAELTEQLKETRQEEKQRQFEIKKKLHTQYYNPSIASSEKIGKVQEYLESGGATTKILTKRTSTDSTRRGSNQPCAEKRAPCIVKVERPQGGCGTWANFQKERDKEEFFRKLSAKAEELMKAGKIEAGKGEREGSQAMQALRAGRSSKSSQASARSSEFLGEGTLSEPSKASEVSTVALNNPTFYIISPFPGARMMFVTKEDMLRSRYAKTLPHPKALVKSALKEFETTYGTRVEAIGLAPASLCLFGQFMEYHLGYLICMTTSTYVATVGGRNDTVFFSTKTTSKEVEMPPEMKFPVPSVRTLEMESRNWVNYVMGIVNEFKAHVPGFNCIIHSSAPVRIGLNTCASLQASMYTFLENLTRDCSTTPLEKVDRCSKSEIEFFPDPTELTSRCSSLKFLPIFLCREGHLMFINCRNYKISHYFFDDPDYAFMIASCRQNTTDITIEALEERLKQCMEALDILERNSLLFLELKHLRCLEKRDAPKEVVKRAKYVITEHQRTIEAIRAIKEQDYARVGLLMNQSHASLRDDYEVSSPQIEALIELALKSEGVLGAKMLGHGLNATIIILIKVSDTDKCIRFMKKNYTDKSDKPVFYITKPAGGAFAMSPTVDVPYIL